MRQIERRQRWRSELECSAENTSDSWCSFTVAEDPFESEHLPERFAYAAMELRSLEAWIERQVQGVLPKLELRSDLSPMQQRIALDRQWAIDNPEEAQRIVDKTLLFVDGICGALGSRPPGHGPEDQDVFKPPAEQLTEDEARDVG